MHRGAETKEPRRIRTVNIGRMAIQLRVGGEHAGHLEPLLARERAEGRDHGLRQNHRHVVADADAKPPPGLGAEQDPKPALLERFPACEGEQAGHLAIALRHDAHQRHAQGLLRSRQQTGAFHHAACGDDTCTAANRRQRLVLVGDRHAPGHGDVRHDAEHALAHFALKAGDDGLDEQQDGHRQRQSSKRQAADEGDEAAPRTRIAQADADGQGAKHGARCLSVCARAVYGKRPPAVYASIAAVPCISRPSSPSSTNSAAMPRRSANASPASVPSTKSAVA